jgi:high affinity sulfate transporter 1
VTIAWKQEFLLFPTLRGYRRQWLAQDLVAGVIFGAVTMPGQLATAHLAGMPPVTGLYGFAVATVVAAAVSTNRHLALGVDSTVAPILATGLIAVGATLDTPHYIALALLTAFLVGVFTLLIGIGRLGWVGDFLSRPVMIGFFGGIAVIIIVHQIPGLLGISDGHGRTVDRIIQLFGQVRETNIPSLILGVVSLALLLGLARISRRIPSALIVLVLSTLAVIVFRLRDDGVKVLGPLQRGLPSIQLPQFSFEAVEAVLTTVLVVAIFCLAQTAATTRSAANLGGFEADINADFRALGLANIASSLVGSFTINASPPSTTILAESRGRSQLASLIASAMAVVVLFFSQLIENLPMATLSAVLIYIGIKIFRVDQMKATAEYSWRTFMLMLTALFGTVVLGIVHGVLVAVVVSFIYQASSTARPELLRLGRSSLGTWLPLSDDRATPVPGIAAFALNGPLWLGNADWFRIQLIGTLPNESNATSGGQPDLLVLDARRIDDVDFTGFEALADIAEVAALRGVPFLVVVQEGRAEQAFKGGRFAEFLSRSQFFDTIPLAIAAYPELRANQQTDRDTTGHDEEGNLV